MDVSRGHDLFNNQAKRAHWSEEDDRNTTLTCQNSQEVLHSHLVPPVINLNVFAIQVKLPARIGIDRPWELVPSVARGVIGEHENDVGVRNA